MYDQAHIDAIIAFGKTKLGKSLQQKIAASRLDGFTKALLIKEYHHEIRVLATALRDNLTSRQYTLRQRRHSLQRTKGLR